MTRRVLIYVVCFLLGWVGAGVAGAKEAHVAKRPSTPELFDSGVPRGESELLAQWFGDFAKGLKGRVLQPIGGTQPGRDFDQARAAQILKQIEGMRRELGQKV